MIKRKKKQKINASDMVILCIFMLIWVESAVSLDLSSEFVQMASSPTSGGVDLIREVFGGMSDQRMCPGVGVSDEEAAARSANCQEGAAEDDSTPLVANPHKITGCRELRLGGGSKNLTFSCDCKYMRPNRNGCDLKRKAPEYEPVHDSCLFVYVGMAV